MVTKTFSAVPLGTRFAYNGAMYIKLAVGAAQCLSGAHAGTVFSLAADAIIETA